MTTHTLPFGKHKGRPPADVPADYLDWMLRTCKLTPGLRGAIRGELLGRGADPSSLPPEPEAKALPQCRGCGGDEHRLHWQQLAGAGARVIRADCRRCGQYVCFAPQTAENLSRADAAPPPIPELHRHPAGERFEVVLVAEAAETPAIVRLRQLLKQAQRQWRFRCASARALTPQAAQDGPEGNQTARRPGGAAEPT